MKKIIISLIFIFLVVINVFSATRTKHIEDDGFVWIEVSENSFRNAALDVNGYTIIPMCNAYINYRARDNFGYFEVTYEDGKTAYMSRSGRVIIPSYKDLTCVYHKVDGHIGYFSTHSNGNSGIYDINGNEIFSCKYDVVYFSSSSNAFLYKDSNGEMIESDKTLDSQGKCINKSDNILYKVKNNFKELWGVSSEAVELMEGYIFSVSDYELKGTNNEIVEYNVNVIDDARNKTKCSVALSFIEDKMTCTLIYDLNYGDNSITTLKGIVSSTNIYKTTLGRAFNVTLRNGDRIMFCADKLDKLTGEKYIIICTSTGKCYKLFVTFFDD